MCGVFIVLLAGKGKINAFQGRRGPIPFYCLQAITRAMKDKREGSAQLGFIFKVLFMFAITSRSFGLEYLLRDRSP